MFTGLIQSLGQISPKEGDQFIISIPQNQPQIILKDLEIGDSVGVDGVCLTVESILENGFIATSSPETLKRTTLGKRDQSSPLVNLETSLRMGSKLGGHFVTGHVDGIGCLKSSIKTDQAWELIFNFPELLKQQWQDSIARYLVIKGSVSVNGISLTIADCDEGGNWFKVAVIPHTYHNTNLAYLKVGNLVNLEGDILGKYVEKLLKYDKIKQEQTEDITKDFLTENGYI